MLKFEGEKNKHEEGRIVINKIDFTTRNLTSNAGLFLLLENAKANGIFELIDKDLVFDNESTNKIKMNHVKTLLCGHFIGIDKLERLKLLQGDPLVNEFGISVKEPETVSRFLETSAIKQLKCSETSISKSSKSCLIEANSDPSLSTLTAV